MLYVPPRQMLRSLLVSGYSMERIAQLTGSSERTLYRVMAEDNDIKLKLYCAIYALWEATAKGGENGND